MAFYPLCIVFVCLQRKIDATRCHRLTRSRQPRCWKSVPLNSSITISINYHVSIRLELVSTAPISCHRFVCPARLTSPITFSVNPSFAIQRVHGVSAVHATWPVPVVALRNAARTTNIEPPGGPYLRITIKSALHRTNKSNRVILRVRSTHFEWLQMSAYIVRKTRFRPFAAVCFSAAISYAARFEC